MLGSYGIQPVTLVFNNSKNCFLHLSSNLVTKLSLQENQVLELSGECGPAVFLSWIRAGHSGSSQGDRVELSRQLGEKLSLQDGDQCFLKPCIHVQSVQQVFVEPLSSDDWEILELHSAALEQHLLDQIRVVFVNGVFPVWVDQRIVIYVKIASFSPSVLYGRLEQFTELIVSPKVRAGEKQRSHVTTETNANNQHLQREQKLLYGSNTKDPNESLNNQLSFNKNHCGDRQSGMKDLLSLLRYMFTGKFEQEKVIPEVPVIPAIIQDCVLRVCGSPPAVISHLDSNNRDVHVLPWDHVRSDCWSTGQPVLTYGKLSKISSPEEVRRQVKQAMESKKAKNEDLTVEQKDSETSVVVRMILHNAEKLQRDQQSPQTGEIYCGKVWIPNNLRTRLNLVPHSAVKLHPMSCSPKVALAVTLQPLQALNEGEREEDVQSAFLGWLHAQSHQPLTCLTERSDIILLPCTDGKSEFVLTVLKPEAEPKQENEIFFLSPSCLHRTDIQVVKEPLSSLNHATPQAAELSPAAGFPSLSSLGGIKEMGACAFEHIFHSLLGSPLCYELTSTGRGLRSGALLITGAQGSGKTSLSRALCRKAVEELDVHLEVLECKKFKGKRAETVRQRLEEVLEQAVWRQPSVVLLDDLDHITGAAATPEQEHGVEAVLHQHIAQSLNDLVDELVERCSLVTVVVTAQSEHTLHPTLTGVQNSHFFQSFCKIEAPDQVQRVDILRALMTRKNIVAKDPEILDLDAIAMKTEGYFPQDLNLLLDRAIHASAVLNQSHDNTDVWCLSDVEVQHALQGFTPPSLWGVQLQVPCKAGLGQVGGLHHARQLLMDTILLPAKYPLLFSSLPIRHQSGVLLYGAPGTGKTLLAGAVAKESGMNFISIKGPELLSKYIGASEQAVRDVFQRAQAAKPCILFFDEFDSLAPRRGHDSTGVTDRVVNQLLTQLDGVEGLQGVYVLAATSRPDLIDPALMRPGRLDKALYFPPPDQEARLEILQALTSSMALATDVDLEQIAVTTEFFTGADLKALLYNAQLEAIHNSLGPSLLPDLGSGSDSDMSVSSLIFLNPSSGSDDSAGEAETGMDASAALLEHGDMPTEGPQHNIWRLYFGSSFELELGNYSPSELNSHCVSVPNSTNHELTGASAREAASLCCPALMSSVQKGFQELSPEQAEHLKAELLTIKSSYCKSLEDINLGRTGSNKPVLLICQSHLSSALANTRASLSTQDWTRYSQLYESFGSSKAGKPQNTVMFTPGQRVTLA